MTRTQKTGGRFCLECHWESFKMAEENPSSLANNCVDPSMCWGDSQPEHCSAYPSCQNVDQCCDKDTCSVECSSVCDGFVACDASTICSEMLCESQDCQNTTPVCFDQSCIADGTTTTTTAAATATTTTTTTTTATTIDEGICDILDQGSSFNWNTTENLLHSSNAATHFNNPFHPQHNTATGGVGHNMHSTNHFTPSEPSLISKNYAFQFHQDHQSSSLHQPALAGSSNSSGSIINQTIDLCPTLDNCNHQSHFGPVFSDCNPDEFLGFIPMEFQSQFHSLYPQLYPRFDGGLTLPCEMQPEHVHKNTSLPAQHTDRLTSSSRDSVQLYSSPSMTPLSKSSNATSPLTSPDVEPMPELHICRCIIKNKPQSTLCGAAFPDASKLQEHLIQAHVGMVEGSQGHGFYCCWEGCHRPDEPFSQKSKLQGHFLTHSNHKGFQCSTCGKFFARQATLERHERSHRGEKPYACKLCQKAFTDSSELKTHMRIHTGEKPFKCNYPGCTFETGDSSNMSSHKLTHGVRKHKCNFPGCSKSFTRPDQLKRHIKTTHKQDTNSSLPLSSPIVEQFPLPQFKPPSAHPSVAIPYQTVAVTMP
ncbi:zinc-responsiveness transcriptional activator [Blastomyces dermatitidis ATCC 18188]|uniref:Zinc-responsiveness transcriptional activator n=1 Tax=Ajellomyces dermatitidis (strain ATCC 18188 / CBS 674.68) TaxID=653446 RepID=F2TBZ9_AJEDA|nr:zinc-responsiveness transcriptional activator [Blastomyces dermatitidis ATCC 18188]